MGSKDDVILKYKVDIEKLEEEISNIKWKPITNCKVEFLNKEFNLNVFNDHNQLVEVWAYYNSLKCAYDKFKNLNITKNGFKLSEWLEDIESRILYISNKEKSKTLKSMKSKLEALLSDDKKVELELNSLLDEFKSLKG